MSLFEGVQLSLDDALPKPDQIAAVIPNLPRTELLVRKTPPTPTPAFRTYWQFAKKRQDVFFARLSSNFYEEFVSDAILRRYRFTNVFRASDRVSQYLI